MTVDSISVVGEPELTGDVTVSQGGNITLTQVGQDIEIAAACVGEMTYGLEGRTITTYSPIFSCSGWNALNSGIASAAWPSANDPLAVPFRTAEDMTISHFAWLNGSAGATDNFDIGIYDTSFNQIITTGSVLRGGANIWQTANVADTLIPAGSYYLCCANNGITANQLSVHAGLVSILNVAFQGCFDSATNAFPLPDPLTNMAAATVMTRIPVMGFVTRVPF